MFLFGRKRNSLAFTGLKSITEKLEKDVKYVNNNDSRTNLLLTLNLVFILLALVGYLEISSSRNNPNTSVKHLG